MELACIMMCTCGGRVERLKDAIYYVLTSKQTIRFGGICNKCGQEVRVEKLITELHLMCPIEGKAH